ncbi:MAG: hypothetical protein JNM68_06330 [Dinghuibacter sp.]|nr:hypothetical protein [Dinghuibacter sp.]
MKKERLTELNAVVWLLRLMNVEAGNDLHAYTGRALLAEFLRTDSRYIINDKDDPWFSVLLDGLAVVQENNNGAKTTTRVITAGSLLSLPVNMSGWKNQNVEVVAVTPTCIGTITAMHYEVICGMFPVFERAVEAMAKRAVQEQANRAALLCMEPEKRYVQFANQLGKPALRIPDKLLATYLDMDKKTLKQLRNNRIE